MMTSGKWTCSTNEEHWDCSEEFDTRDEAFAYASGDFAEEHGFVDGRRFYIGQVVEVSLDKLAEAATPDADTMLEDIGEWLYENVGDGFSDSFACTKAQADDLEARLTLTIRMWMAVHNLTPNCFTLEHVESHVWEQCKETRPPELGDRPVQCLLAIEHDGECEWL